MSIETGTPMLTPETKVWDNADLVRQGETNSELPDAVYEQTTNGQAKDANEILEKARDPESGDYNYGELSEEDRTRLSDAITKKLLGEDGNDTLKRVSDIVGGGDVADKAIAIMGREAASDFAARYGGRGFDNPLADMLKERLEAVELQEREPHSEASMRAVGGRTLEAAAPDSSIVPLERIRPVEGNEAGSEVLGSARAVTEIGSVLANLDDFVIIKNSDGSLTIRSEA